MILQSLLIYTIAISFFYFLAVKNASGYSIGLNNDIRSWEDKPFISLPTIILIVFFSIFCGIRFNVGTDYIQYLSSYLNYDSRENQIAGSWEQGFVVLMKFCFALDLSPMFFFGLIGFLQFLFFLLAFRREQYLWPLVIFFFFVNGGFLLWMNGMRQCLAMCIWMCSLYYIEDKKIIPYYLLGLLAVQFHTSAILLFILYPILRLGKSFFNNRFLQYSLLLLSFVIQFLGKGIWEGLARYMMPIFDDAYSNYLWDLTQYKKYTNTNMAVYARLLLYCIIIFYSNGMHTFYSSKRFNIIYTLFFVGIFGRFMIPPNMSILMRPLLYFTFFDSIMFAFFVYYLSKSHLRNDKYIIFLMVLIPLGIFVGNQIVSGEYSSVRYQFYFNQPLFNLQV